MKRYPNSNKNLLTEDYENGYTLERKYDEREYNKMLVKVKKTTIKKYLINVMKIIYY